MIPKVIPGLHARVHRDVYLHNMYAPKQQFNLKIKKIKWQIKTWLEAMINHWTSANTSCVLEPVLHQEAVK